MTSTDLTRRHIVSVSWGDHLSFGEDDGRLDTPEKVAHRMTAWRDELGARVVHWRMLRTRVPGHFMAGRNYEHPSRTAGSALAWDDLRLVPHLAQDAGLVPWLYVSVVDEGWPLARPSVRAVSYHNSMHAQHVAWQSELTRQHRDWLVVDRSGRRRQMGVVSLAYPDARRAFIDRWLTLLAPTTFAGLFLCLRSQSRPVDGADDFGFNEPAVADFRAQFGVDVRREPFDVQAWRNHLGRYLTMLLTETRHALTRQRRGLGVGAARGDVLGPPLGNTTLHWRDWIRDGLIDHLVIDQSSSQCPSMWHQLWPMHRGTGYVQNYLDGSGLPPLAEYVASTYAPAILGSKTKLFIARQWSPRDEAIERALTTMPGVDGLVFSSFRHDNPGAIARGDWRAGQLRRHDVASNAS